MRRTKSKDTFEGYCEQGTAGPAQPIRLTISWNSGRVRPPCRHIVLDRGRSFLQQRISCPGSLLAIHGADLYRNLPIARLQKVHLRDRSHPSGHPYKTARNRPDSIRWSAFRKSYPEAIPTELPRRPAQSSRRPKGVSEAACRRWQLASDGCEGRKPRTGLPHTIAVCRGSLADD